MLCPVDLHECERAFDCEDLGCRQVQLAPPPATLPRYVPPLMPPHRGGYSGEEQE